LQEKEEGNRLYKQKKLPEALTHYQRAIELDPAELTFYLNKAACLLEMGNQMEKDVTALKEKEAAEGLVETVAAEVLDKEEATEKEKAKLREAEEAKRRERQRQREQAKPKVLREKKTDKATVDGEIAADDSDDEEEPAAAAEEEPAPLVETPPPEGGERPDLAPSWVELAKALPSTQKERERQRLYAAAVEACEAGLAQVKEGSNKYEQVAKLYLRLGNVYTKQGRLQDALTCMKKSMLEHRLDEAVRKEKELRDLIKKKEEEDYLDPAKGEEARLAGNMEFSKGNFAKAIEFYSDAVRRNPKDVRVYSNRAASHSKLMNWSAAIDDCDKAIALDPKFIKVYIRTGNVQMFLKQYPQAMTTFQTAMELDPTNTDVQQGYQDLVNRIQQSQSSGQADEQQVAEAMKDPEIRSIVQDPMMQTILQDMQTNPARAQAHMQNPKVAQAIMKLMAAGILKTR
jgi:tetratricopeptide (TPR) repeat protein